MVTRLIGAFALGAVLCISCGDDAPDSSPTVVVTPGPTTFEEGPCVVPPPAGQLAGDMQCGTLTVPENRAAQDGRTIRLPVVVLKAIGEDTAPDPLVYLSGGPGISALQGDLPAYEDWLAHPIQLRRDMVFFDQRGTGFSEPALTCFEGSEDFYVALGEPLSGRALTERARELNLACRDRLIEAGVNLSAYRSTAIVEDVAALMGALGYEEWNLYGFSYGARIALTAVRERPEGLRSVILDSPIPLQIDPGSRPATLQTAFERVLSDCAAHAACGAAYPDLSARLWSVVARLNETPAAVQVDAAGTPVVVMMTGERLVDAMYRQVSSGLHAQLPADIDALSSGDHAALEPYAASLAARWGYIADAMLISVMCAEELPFVTEEDVARGSAGVRAEIVGGLQVSGSAFGVDPSGTAEDLEAVQRFCAAWDVDPADPVEDQPVTSDIPALILSGQYDPGTPPSNGMLVAETLTNSQFIEMPNAVHSVVLSYPLCALAIAAHFLDEPAAKTDTSCVDGVPTVDWKLP